MNQRTKPAVLRLMDYTSRRSKTRPNHQHRTGGRMSNVIHFWSAANRIRYRRIAKNLTDKTKWCQYIRHDLPIDRSCEGCRGCDKRGA